MFEKIKKWYKQGLWTIDMVLSAVVKKVINQEEADAIINSK